MSHTLEVLSTAEHGTVDGYRAGCHGSAVSCGATVSCADVYIRYQGDWGFRKRVDAGENPVDIFAEEAAELDAVRERDKAANRKAKAAAARAEKERDEKKARAAAPNLTERIGDDVRRLISEGKTVREIAAELKVAIASVTRTREALGIKGPPPRIIVDVAEVARLHAEGYSDTVIARRMGVANSTIRRTKLKLPRLSPKVARAHEESPRAARQRRIVELHGQGMTDQQIADELGITRSAVYQARGRLDLPLNRSRTRGPSKPRTTPRVERVELAPAADVTHGTPDGYTAGCRGRGCPTSPTCTDAMLAAHRAARREAGGQ
ncbi:helix-turn-helix domain-containing protein [Microbacterium sp. p3-SID131]|uniref:helix-turn-helix domain-containing protein n=1 Tax=Microbacterium sp. p3-SID131 TaxID=2916215 RepID=UPI0021A31B1C|nr:helix-turn-helix domain-containing protein [Microbacterium sp. p3-SID131]MCT1363944.1 helix-turn-helix domain-containing protein [Microbacterium sp. p3-SID131]